MSVPSVTCCSCCSCFVSSRDDDDDASLLRRLLTSVAMATGAILITVRRICSHSSLSSLNHTIPAVYLTAANQRIMQSPRSLLAPSNSTETCGLSRHVHHRFICPIIQQYAHLHRYNFRRAAGQRGPTRTLTAAPKRVVKKLLGTYSITQIKYYKRENYRNQSFRT